MTENPIYLKSRLTQLPKELQLRIFEVLPSFFDALSLSATCHTLHDLWRDHRTGLVNEIVLRQFECFPFARELLARQRNGPTLAQEDLSNRDLTKLIRNARHVEQFIESIEQELIPELKLDGLPKEKSNTIYDGKDTHPPTLTPTERLRVIKAAYQIWFLACCCTDEEVYDRVPAMRPRELFYFSELTEWSRKTGFPTGDRWETLQIGKAKRRAMMSFYNKTYNCGEPVFQQIQAFKDPVRLFVIWDHWQDDLRSAICRRPVANLEWDVSEKVREDLWDYEPGDEFLLSSID